MKIWMNGNIIEEQEAVVSVYDHGFLYGMGLFETFRTYDGLPFLLDRHLRRLLDGCRMLGIDFRADVEEVTAQIGALLQANGLKDAYVRLSVSAGEELLGLPSADYRRPTVLIYMKELPPRDVRTYGEGKDLQLLRTRRNSPEGEIRLKSFHYMNNIVAKREMRDYPWASGAEGLFLDGHGRLAEGIVSNVFFVRDGRCCTPSLDTGILPGITRGYVMELAQDLGLPVEEGHYRWEDLLEAEEAFLTNSIQEIVPVKRCFDPQGAEHRMGSRTHTPSPGPITKKLMNQYR